MPYVLSSQRMPRKRPRAPTFRLVLSCGHVCYRAGVPTPVGTKGRTAWKAPAYVFDCFDCECELRLSTEKLLKLAEGGAP